MKLSVLIVCYNSLSDMPECMSSLMTELKTLPHETEVLITDNSNDGTFAWVEEHYPEATLIESKENLGFAGGNNLLAEHATGDYFLLLNPDTSTKPGAIKTLLRISEENPSHCAWGGITTYPNGKQEYSSKQTGHSLRAELCKLFGIEALVTPQFKAEQTEIEVPVLSGAFMLVKKEDWQAVSGFDTSYFMYSEEVDLCKRLAEYKGKPPLLTKQAQITHFVGQSSNPAKRKLMILKGKMHLDKKFYGTFHNTAMFLTLWAYCLTRFATQLIKAKFGDNNVFKDAAFKPSFWSRGYSN